MAGEVPTTQLSLTTPAGSDNISAGDNRIRELKTQFQEILDVDHDVPTDAYAADVGQHKQVTLQEVGDIGTGASGVPILGAQTVVAPELVYTDEGDNDVVITDAGYLAGGSLVDGSYDIQSTNLKYALIDLIYPVGSIYANATVSTNPGTLLGRGTWVAIEEEVIAGYKSGGTFDPVGSLTEGAETVKLTGGESGTSAHTHTLNTHGGSEGSDRVAEIGQTGVNASTVTTNASSEANADDAHNNIQPTYVAYLWRRTV